MTDHNKPLAGIKVIDLTQIYQGPYAAFLFAMAGADVIKIEPVNGERLRGAGGAKTPLSFAMLNSNKKSVTLNLRDEEGKKLLRKLVKDADVLLENYAPGVMDRLGVGWEDLKQINPQLVYGSGTGYGLSGPDRDLLAMDHTIQAASGVMSVTGDEDAPPSRAGGAPCDIMGGIHIYAGVLAALQGQVTALGLRFRCWSRCISRCVLNSVSIMPPAKFHLETARGHLPTSVHTAVIPAKTGGLSLFASPKHIGTACLMSLADLTSETTLTSAIQWLARNANIW